MSEERRWTISDLEVVSAIDVACKRPQIYLAKGVPLGIDLARQLIEQLVLNEVLPAALERSGDWWLISSAKDWIGSDFHKRGLFEHPVPDGGRYEPYSFHKEFLLGAFARAVVVVTRGELLWVKGSQTRDPLPLNLSSFQSRWALSLAFTADETVLVP